MSTLRLISLKSSAHIAILPLAAISLLTGCAKGNSNGSYAKPLPAGQTCHSIQQELRRMDASGAQGSVEAVNAGRKVSQKRRAQAARYNQLLEDYLGAQCHAPRPKNI